MSCFNFFRLPPCWLKFMCSNKLVSAKAFGGPPGKQVYAAMCFTDGMDLVCGSDPNHREDPGVQGVRGAGGLRDAKAKPVPDGDDLTVIYLDSF